MWRMTGAALTSMVEKERIAGRHRGEGATTPTNVPPDHTRYFFNADATLHAYDASNDRIAL